MKIKQTNAEGVEEEIEVSTAAEVEAKVAAEKTALETKHQEAIQAQENNLKTIEQGKKELEDKIAKLERDGMKDDHPNFKVLKDALNKKDDEIKGIRTALDDDKKQRVAEEMESQIKVASRGNEDLEKKIKYHLEKTVMGLPEGTKAERKTKLEAAFKLASDGSSEGPGMFDMGAGGGGPGGGGNGGGAAANEFSAREKQLGKKLGITEEDYKKYGPRVSKRNN